MRLDDDRWVPFDDYAQAILRSAKAAGLPRSEVVSMGRRYETRRIFGPDLCRSWSFLFFEKRSCVAGPEEVDFKQMCQKSKDTGKQRQIRERFLHSGADVKTWKEEPALSERQKRASVKTVDSINAMQDAWPES